MQKKTTLEKAFGRKYPEQVVLVTTRSKTGKVNVMAVGWVTFASTGPWMFALGIDDEAYTYELIRKTREFVVAYPSDRMAKAVLFAGTHHGHKMDKIAKAGLKLQPALKIKAPLIADAVANFECKLAKIVQPGDCPIIFGKIVATHENRDGKVKRLFNVGKNYTLTGVKAVRR